MVHGSHMDWKTWKKMRKRFPVREKSGNFEHTGKVREFYPKYWKSEEILASFFSLIFKLYIYLLNRFLNFLNSLNKTLKNTGKWKENTGKVRDICQSENVGTMMINHRVVY